MLGPRIAAARRQAGLSQAALAQRLKISASAMGMYEQGRREPSVETLVALSRELGVSTDYLLTGKPQDEAELERITRMLLDRVDQISRQLDRHREGTFSREELTMLLAAVLIDP